MKTIAAIPGTSRTIEAVDGRGGVAVNTRQTPAPQKNEVLIRMAASPVNPSDLVVLFNQSGTARNYPIPAGREGAGLVVASGGGPMANFMLGKRVAVASGTGGLWSEYAIAKATNCAPLRKDLSYEQGSMILVNPLTAYAVVSYALEHGHKALVNTAAAGAFGPMIYRYAERRGVNVINVVRRESQAQALKSDGQKFVLNSSKPDFTDELRRLTHELTATLLLDAVGGVLTGQLVEASPAKSTVLLYGNLAQEAPTFSAFRLLNDHKKIEGFFLGNWSREVGFVRLLRAISAVQKLVPTDFATRIARKFLLSEIESAVLFAREQASEGKSLLAIDTDLIAL